MELNDYQRRARDEAVHESPFAGSMHSLIRDERILGPWYAATGVASEGGEVLDEVKKALRDDHKRLTPERKEKILLEMGDTLWYLADLATELDTDLETVAHLNLAKLRNRAESLRLLAEFDDDLDPAGQTR